MEKIKKKLFISDAKLKSEILDQFNKGYTGKMEVFGIIRQSFTLARDRYSKLYTEAYSEWANLTAKGQADAIVAGAEKAVKKGLKSVFGKKQHIQQQIDEIQAELDNGTYLDSIVVGGEVKDVERKLSPETKTTMRRVMKDLYVELNKMDGDYAPKKIATTDTAGNDIEQPLTPEMLKEILQAIK